MSSRSSLGSALQSLWLIMPKYYCDYCDTYLTHDSPSVRKTHCSGRKHKDSVRDYYQHWLEEQVQKIVDETTAAFKNRSARGIALPPPGMLPPGYRPGMPLPPMVPGVPPPVMIPGVPPPGLARPPIGLPPPGVAPGLPPGYPPLAPPAGVGAPPVGGFSAPPPMPPSVLPPGVPPPRPF